MTLRMSKSEAAKFGIILCAKCGLATEKNGPTQKYCRKCSEERDLIRKKLWAREHPTNIPAEVINARQARRKERSREAGLVANAKQVKSIAWTGDTIDLEWIVRVAVPFSYAASKNHIYSLSPRGHVFLRKESVAIRESITTALKRALAGREVVQNKIWLDILVQKPNHKGDAVNVVDLVCDGVKRALTVDDRWFCIRRLDWQIVKHNPRLFVGIGQEKVVESQVCCYCGIIKPAKHFGKRSGGFRGIGRECKKCRRVGRVLGKPQVSATPLFDEPSPPE